MALALFGRVILLLCIGWVMTLNKALFTVRSNEFSGRDLILLGGGLFLLAKATHEIHSSMEGGGHAPTSKAASFGSVLLQILILDVVFSLDSVITAVGMAKDIPVMIAAVVIAIVFMMFSAAKVSDFIHRHPTVKILALAFLLLVGIALVVDGWGGHLPRGYIYFAMGFSVLVEMLNLRSANRRASPPPAH